jgi:hypothetical protein
MKCLYCRAKLLHVLRDGRYSRLGGRLFHVQAVASARNKVNRPAAQAIKDKNASWDYIEAAALALKSALSYGIGVFAVATQRTNRISAGGAVHFLL